MHIILPNEGNDLQSVEHQIGSLTLTDLQESGTAESGVAEIYLPKFTLNSTLRMEDLTKVSIIPFRLLINFTGSIGHV